MRKVFYFYNYSYIQSVKITTSLYTLHRPTKYPNVISKTLSLFYPIATVCAGTESTYLIQTKIQFAKKLSSRCRGRLCRSCVVGVLRRIISKNLDQLKFNYTTIEIRIITKSKCSSRKCRASWPVPPIPGFCRRHNSRNGQRSATEN